jgi:hypothetical protein
VNAVAGQLNNKLPPIERIHRAYRERCEVFAECFGYEENEIADWFEQFTFMRMKEQRMAKNLAAFCAWRDLQDFFNKRGCSEPD